MRYNNIALWIKSALATTVLITSAAQAQDNKSEAAKASDTLTHLNDQRSSKEGFSGSMTVAIEYENERHDEDDNESELEYTFLRSKLKHSSLEDFTFKFSLGREDEYEGALGDLDEKNDIYSVGLIYDINKDFSLELGYEYESEAHAVGSGPNTNSHHEYTIAPTYAMEFENGIEAEITFAYTRVNDHDYLDEHWFYIETAVEKEIEDMVLGLELVGGIERGFSGKSDYDYVEWEVRPFVAHELTDDTEVFAAVFFSGEREDDNDDNYKDIWVGAEVGVAYEINSSFEVEMAVAYEEHNNVGGRKDEYYKPSAEIELTYNF